MAKQRLDKAVLDAGLAPSRERAQALILGGHVTIDGQTERRASATVPAGAQVALREPDHPYVSRGALKLVKGLDAFAIDPTGRGVPRRRRLDRRLHRRAAAARRGARVRHRRGLRPARLGAASATRAWWSRAQNVRDMDLALVPEPPSWR
jgi:ribosome-associated protein YbcJ (S4-like RNA binding protein)